MSVVDILIKILRRKFWSKTANKDTIDDIEENKSDETINVEDSDNEIEELEIINGEDSDNANNSSRESINNIKTETIKIKTRDRNNIRDCGNCKDCCEPIKWCCGFSVWIGLIVFLAWDEFWSLFVILLIISCGFICGFLCAYLKVDHLPS